MAATIDIDLQLRRSDFALAAKLTLPGSGITAVCGPSGAGKTTLLRALAGLEPAIGSLQVGARCWQDDQQTLPAHQRPVGFVFQEASLFSHLDVRGNLNYGLQRVPPAARRTTFDDVTQLLSLDALLARDCATLSGGERQRVAIGRALLTSPELLLMDEPLTGLDTAHKRELLPYLDALHRELALPVLYVTHTPEEVARLADHVALLSEGRVVAAGPTGDMLTRLDLPLATAADAAAVIDATVVRTAGTDGLSTLEFAGGELLVAAAGQGGAAIRVRILARDVSLTLERQRNTSILNIVPATVLELKTVGAAHCMVRLDAGGAILLARISVRSAAALDLQPGRQVYAQIKAAALLDQHGTSRWG